MFGFLVILLCIAAYFHYKHHGCHPYKSEHTHQNALDIVRERYARGEISSEEFIERKRTLEEGKAKNDVR